MSVQISLPAIDKERSLRAMFRTALMNPLAVMAFLFPVAIVFDVKLVPVFLVVALVGIVVCDWPLRPALWWPIGLVFGLFIAWAALSAVWSIDPMHSLTRFFRFSLAVFGGLLLCGVAASRGFLCRKSVGRALAAGFLTASAISIFIRFGIPISPWQALATYISLMPLLSFGAIAALGIFVLIATLENSPKSPLIYLAIVAAAGAIFFRGNSASMIALVAAVCASALVFWVGRRALVAVAVILPLLFLGPPMLLQSIDFPARAKEMGWTLSHSAGHRLIVWRYVYSHIVDRPILGWGLHASRIMPDKDDVRAADDPHYTDIFEITTLSREAKIGLMPMHPHNATLQTWLELGVIGAVLYATVFCMTVTALWRLRLSRIAMAAGAGLAVSIFTIGQLSFSAWQSWWLCSQFLAAAFFLFTVRKVGPVSADSGPVPGA